MTLVLLHDQYGSRGIAGNLFRNLTEKNLPEDRLPRRSEYHEIEVLTGPGDFWVAERSTKAPESTP